MKKIKFLSAVLAATLMLSSASAIFAADVPRVGVDNIIYYEDFSDDTVHTNYGGKYVVNTGTISNGKYLLDAQNERIVYSTYQNSQINSEISGGVIELSATFNFTTIDGNCNQVWSLVSEVSDDTNKTAFLVKSNSTALQLNAYDKNGNQLSNLQLSTLTKNQDYKITAYVDLDTGRLQMAVNGTMVLTDKELYINPLNYKYDSSQSGRWDNVSRLFDSKNDTGKVVYTVDDICVKRIAHLPLTKLTDEVFSEGFESFNSSGYKAATSIADNIVQMSTVDTSDTTHNNVFKAVKGTRLLKELSENPNGVYSIKTDLYLTSKDVNGIGPKITNAAANATAAQIRITGGKIAVTAAEKEIWSSGYDTEHWYTVEMLFDTTTRNLKLYIDGKLIGDTTATEISDYKRIVDIDNRNNDIDGAYFDNISVTKIADFKTDSEWEEVYFESDFDSVSISDVFDQEVAKGATIQDGYMSIPVGARVIRNYSSGLTDGTYSAEVDVRVKSHPENRCVLFGTENSGGYMIYNVYANGNNIEATGYDDEGNMISVVLLKDYDTTKWYNIKATFRMYDVANDGIAEKLKRRLYFYVNGIEVATNYDLYIGNFDKSVTRLFDFHNTDTSVSVAFDIDNIKFYEDKLFEAIDVQPGKIMGNLTLPTEVTTPTGSKAEVRWITNDYQTLSADGVLDINTATAKYPTLQAMVNDGTTHRATRRYTFYIPATALNFENKTGVTSNIEDFPFVASDGTLIKWTSSHPEIITTTGVVHRPAETTTVTMTATYGEITKTYTIEVLGMNTEDKVFVTENALYSGNDKLIGKIDVKNKTVAYKANLHNATSYPISVNGILAVYKDGNLVNVQISNKQDVAAKTAGDDITLNYTVPNEDGYVLKGMIWDMDTLEPYDVSVDTTDKTADLYVLSDSIYANYATDAHNDEGGIGMYIGDYLNSNITVHNQAHGGRSTRSYFMYHFNNEVLDNLNEGDYMLVSFGINDGASANVERYTDETDYKAFLKLYADIAKDRGVIPFFVTTTPTGTYDGTAVTYSTNPDTRRDWMKAVATAENVPCLQLGESIVEELEKLSAAEQYAKYIQEKTESVYDSETGTKGTMVHINKTRATELAARLTQMIKSAGINGLSGYVNNTTN